MIKFEFSVGSSKVSLSCKDIRKVMSELQSTGGLFVNSYLCGYHISDAAVSTCDFRCGIIEPIDE
jgi:hypothetical protein